MDLRVAMSLAGPLMRNREKMHRIDIGDNSFPPTGAHGALVVLAGAWGSLRLSRIFLGPLVALSGLYLGSPGLSWCVLGLSSGSLGVSWGFWSSAELYRSGFERFA